MAHKRGGSLSSTSARADNFVAARSTGCSWNQNATEICGLMKQNMESCKNKSRSQKKNDSRLDQNVTCTIMSTSSRYAGMCHQPMASDHLFSNQDLCSLGTEVVPPCQSSEIQQAKPIRIPKTLAAGPFLQYPRLTPGQRRYLCSIASIYNTELVRRLIQRHYLNVLHRCTQEDPFPFKESKSEEVSTVSRERLQMESDITTGSTLVAVHSVKGILPKIPIKQTRKHSKPLTSKEIKSQKPKRKIPTMQMASPKGKTRNQEADNSKKSEKTRAEFLSESMEPLSIHEKTGFENSR